MKRTPLISATALAAVITLTGCGSSDDMSGMDHNAKGNGAASSAPAASAGSSEDAAGADQDPGAEHNEADVTFASMMIPHHEQAIEMSEIMLAKADVSTEVTDLAEQIRAAQGPEVETMSSWLQAWGEPVPVGGHSMEDMESMGSMEGMMSSAQLEELEAAEGTEAERLFLTRMIEHHQGAVSMAEQQMEQGSNERAIMLAEEIIAAQEAEIATMNELLETL